MAKCGAALPHVKDLDFAPLNPGYRLLEMDF
jgi:hypothetical protein